MKTKKDIAEFGKIVVKAKEAFDAGKTVDEVCEEFGISYIIAKSIKDHKINVSR